MILVTLRTPHFSEGCGDTDADKNQLEHTRETHMHPHTHTLKLEKQMEVAVLLHVMSKYHQQRAPWHCCGGRQNSCIFGGGKCVRCDAVRCGMQQMGETECKAGLESF